MLLENIVPKSSLGLFMLLCCAILILAESIESFSWWRELQGRDKFNVGLWDENE